MFAYSRARVGLTVMGVAFLAGLVGQTPAPGPTSGPEQVAPPATQPVPHEAQLLLDTIRLMAPDRLDVQNPQAAQEYGARLNRALDAAARLKANFPGIARRPDVRTAELALLFDAAYLQGDVQMTALRQGIAAVQADEQAPRTLKALAEYYLLNADMALRSSRQPASQPDQFPAWLGQELARRIAFGKAYKDQEVGRRAFAEAVILKAQSEDGQASVAGLVDEFIDLFPDDRPAQAMLLGRLALDEYGRSRSGWDKARPLMDRLRAGYRDQPAAAQALGVIALQRLQSDPASGLKLLEELAGEFAGSEPVAGAWAQLVIAAYQDRNEPLVRDRLKLLADKFPQTEARADVLARLAYQEFRDKGLDGAVDTIRKLQAELPQAKPVVRLAMAVAAEHLERVGYEKAVPFLNEVLRKYAGREDVRQLEGMANRFRTVGKDFQMSFTSADGQPVDLGRMRGRVVVVYFWATWCEPCTGQMARTLELAGQFASRDVRFVGVSLDRDREALLEYQRANKLPWVSFFDGRTWDNELALRWGINSIPRFLVVDREGKLVSPGTADHEELRGLLDRLTESGRQAGP